MHTHHTMSVYVWHVYEGSQSPRRTKWMMMMMFLCSLLTQEQVRLPPKPGLCLWVGAWSHCHSFGHCPKFTTIGEDESVSWPVNQELRLLALLFLHHNTLISNHINPAADLTLHLSLNIKQDFKANPIVSVMDGQMDTTRHMYPQHGINICS